MQLHEVISHLESRFELGEAEDFDNVGLLCGRRDQEITGILVCHDALEKVVEEAIMENKNLIVCFHPILFKGLKSLTGKDYVEKAILKAIENKIAIYALHTAFDNDYFGVSFGMAQKLELENQKVLMPKKGNLSQLVVYVPKDYAMEVKEALFKAGAGSLGYYEECSFSVSGEGTFRPKEGSNPFSGHLGERAIEEEEMLSVVFESYKSRRVLKAMEKAHPYEEVAYQLYSLENKNGYSGLGRVGELKEPMKEDEFLNKVKQIFQIPVIRHSGLLGKDISKVAVLGGSGASGIEAAKAVGADAYLCGDLKYHDFFTAESSLLLLDIGHFESERFVTEQLFEIISEIFPKFAVLKSQEKTNPVNYFL